MLFAPIEGLASDAVCVRCAGKAVDGAVGGGVVEPQPAFDAGVGGFRLIEEGEAA